MIYLDNAATSFPKPREVVEATHRALEAAWGNPGRSGHALSRAGAEAVWDAREKIAGLLALKGAERVVFTSGATAALNLAVLGLTEALSARTPIPWVACDSYAHNSVLRPLFRLEKKGRIRLSVLPLRRDGALELSPLQFGMPQLLVITARSNLTGYTPPLREISRLAHARGAIVLLDGAQLVGSWGADFEATEADWICGAGHKGLFGMMGGGFLAGNDHTLLLPEAILSGGSGNESQSALMPKELPERLEAGTLPLPAILSMAAGADFLARVGVEEISHREREKKKLLAEGLSLMPAYRCYGGENPEGPLLIVHRTIAPEALAEQLDREGILTRAGLHCAPLGHRALGTGPLGALRLSPGLFTAREELQKTLWVLSRLARTT